MASEPRSWWVVGSTAAMFTLFAHPTAIISAVGVSLVAVALLVLLADRTTE
ncbi:MAG: hypothetical protein GY745_15105 [Actinomycetia bacterium]|nr:hypothetical protein [Actinomycetes bacterium]MCP4086361.1 hypothetical protein [Actinomycetes bacterium]